MKRTVTLFACLLLGLLCACGARGEAVFDEDREIVTVTRHSIINQEGDTVVPEEYLDEVVQWLRQFRVGKRVGRTLVPGTGSVSVTVVYADGECVTVSIGLVVIDGVRYKIEAPDAPECWVNGFS